MLDARTCKDLRGDGIERHTNKGKSSKEIKHPSLASADVSSFGIGCRSQLPVICAQTTTTTTTVRHCTALDWRIGAVNIRQKCSVCNFGGAVERPEPDH
jgi:hypothetical protein